MAVFHLEIVSPENIVFSGEVDHISVPTLTGTLTILPHHISLFTVLEEGELKVSVHGKEQYFSTGGGFMEVRHDKTTILVERAMQADEIDEKKVIEAQEKAKEILKQKPEGEQLITAQAAFRRSLIDLKIARKRKKHQNL